MQLHITGLTKKYPGGVLALDDVTLSIGHGMFGLLGPNGAGKSTLMRTLATLQDADSGSVQLEDGQLFVDVLREKGRVRELLGYLPQDFGVYPKMSALRFLDHLAQLKGLSARAQRHDQVEMLLRKTNLWPERDRPLGTFSGGMRQRFGIAQALIGAPRLLIVDEPTAGLDPEERVRFHNLLAEIGEEVVVLLSTHIVADVSDLCPQLAVLHRGRVIVAGAPMEIARRLDGQVYAATLSRSEFGDMSGDPRIISSRLRAGQTVVHMIAAAPPDGRFHAVPPTLEDAYFAAIAGRLPTDGAALPATTQTA